MEILLAALCGFALDLLFGDPDWLTHPVVIMGRCITHLERRLRALFPKTNRGELWAGAVLAALLPLGTLIVCGSALWLCGLVHPALRFALEAFWCGQALAMKGLRDESAEVWRKLTTDTLEAARKQVGRIVGRDTAELTAEGVTKAAVETVAENFSDGVIAPLCFMILGGAPLALCYKAINTMDSMVGYRNERYLYFGRAAARLDDAANYLPARLSALLLIAAAGLTGHDMAGAWRIWRRDRRNHASPNSAQTEAAMAGALGVQLAGPAHYFGQYDPKPTIGDSLRPVEPNDILRANRMLYAAGFLGLALLAGARALITFGW
ncbi:MAG: adenosylcobinamide-phosphate synthase CbiB [Clostridia bacterium]|nr:adenosylcobinamide-phosphate synthase CbiB [Clostridia bacterium]